MRLAVRARRNVYERPTAVPDLAMGTWGDSWTLTRTSFRMIREDHALLWIPLIGGLCLFGLVVLALLPFLIVFLATGSVPALAGSFTLLFVAMYVALYFLLVFVGVFFTAALVGAAMLKLNGGSPTVRDGIRVAQRRIGRLLVWSLFAASVGLVIQLVASRLGGIASLLLRLGAEVAWGVATYFIVPVVLFEDLPTFGSLRRSAGLYLQNFGRTIGSNIVLSLIGVGLAAVGIVLFVVGLVLGVGGNVPVGFALLGVGALVLVGVAVLLSAAAGVLQAALYRYATTGQITPGMMPRNFPPGVGPAGAPLPSSQFPPTY